jgi:putative tryptophan/tyrosine transport system substrate-binding protein
MRRRAFIKFLGIAAAAWPLTVIAQQPALPVIGYLSARSPEDTGHLVEAFRRGLSEAGFVEGQNVMVEYRWARGQQDRLPDLAADLVRKPVTLLVSTGGEAAALAAKGKTSTIPIAFIIGGDPVKLGLVATYQRPGANATGITILTATLEPKRLELLRELLPNVSTVGALLDPNFPPYEAQLRDLREAARLSACKFKIFGSAMMQLSIKRSKRLQVRRSVLSPSSPDRSLTHDATRSSPWLHAMPCQQCIISANLLRQAD